MEKHRKEYAEFRFYEKPVKEPVLALMGDRWIRHYGESTDYLHFHNMAEVGFCTWGSGDLVFNKKIHQYEGGTFTFIPHNWLHTTNSRGICCWEYFFFDLEELIKDHFHDNPEAGNELLKLISRKAYIGTQEDEPCVTQVVQMIFEQMRRKESYYKETIKGLLFTLLMQIARKSEDTGESSRLNEAGSSKISPSLEYISYHYREDIRISELARCCHLSETHFRRLFQEDMNMSPVEYLNLTRVQAACDLMRKGDSHMEEVAVKVGYQTMSTFNRNFRQILDTSPYQWKKQMELELEKIERYHISAKKGW